MYLIGANGARALTSNSVQAFYVDGPRFCFLSHFAAPITTPYISQRAVYMYFVVVTYRYCSDRLICIVFSMPWIPCWRVLVLMMM